MAGSVEEPVAKAVSLSAKTIVLRCTVAYNHNDLEDRIHSPAFQCFFPCMYVIEKNLIFYCF